MSGKTTTYYATDEAKKKAEADAKAKQKEKDTPEVIKHEKDRK